MPFYERMLNKKLTTKDIETIDPVFYNLLITSTWFECNSGASSRSFTLSIISTLHLSVNVLAGPRLCILISDTAQVQNTSIATIDNTNK